ASGGCPRDGGPARQGWSGRQRAPYQATTLHYRGGRPLCPGRAGPCARARGTPEKLTMVALLRFGAVFVLLASLGPSLCLPSFTLLAQAKPRARDLGVPF